MAEPLSLVASLIAVVQISGELVSICYHYRSGVTRASKSILRLSAEARDLRNIIESLLDVINAPNSDQSQLKATKILASQGGMLEDVLADLKILQEKLSPLSGWRATARVLKWPLTEPELDKSLDRINRLKTSLLAATAADQLNLSIRISRTISSVNDKIEDLRVDNATRVKDDQLDALLQWLDAPSAWSNHEAARAKRTAGTGQHIFTNHAYVKWLTVPGSILHITGNAGYGKTVLCSTIIDSLLQQARASAPDNIVLFFYMDTNDISKRTSCGFLKALSSQLITQSHQMRTQISSYRDHWGWELRHGLGGSVEDMLSSIIERALDEKLKLTLVVDAMDECIEVQAMVDLLRRMLDWSILSLNILITSRPSNLVEQAFKDHLNISLEKESTDPDIRTHVALAVAHVASEKSWPPALCAEVSEALIQGSDGMFRWVDCQLTALRKCIKPLALRKALRSLPPRLEDLYCNTLNNIDEEVLADARCLLQWLAVSFQPPSLNEISDVLAIALDETPAFHVDYRPPDPFATLSICGDFIGLVCLPGSLPRDATVTLSHSSVRDFLLSDQPRTGARQLKFTEGEAHAMAAQSCLTYLLCSFTRVQSRATLLELYPLAGYAARYWTTHYRLAENQESIAPLALKFLLDRDRCLVNWTQLYDIDRPWSSGNDSLDEEPASALYYACLSGLTGLVAPILQLQAQSDSKGGLYGSPLVAALRNGYEDTAAALLRAHPHIIDHRHRDADPVSIAAERGFASILQTLLDLGARHTTAGSFEQGTPLTQAALRGQLDCVLVLLDAGADPNKTVGKSSSPLSAAARNNHIDVCRLLLSRGATVDTSQEIFSNETRVAAAQGRVEILQLFFQHGARKTTTILECAAEGGHQDIVADLLESGVPTRGGRYDRPLTAAATAGSLEIVRALLDRGADLDEYNGYWSSPLASAAKAGHTDVVRCLLDQGAQPDACGDFWSPALHQAARCGHLDVVLCLLDHEPPADINAAGCTRSNGFAYGTVLCNAAQSNSIEVVRTLLKCGAGVNEHGGEYAFPLQAAATTGNIEIVRELLNHDALIDAFGGEHGTALEAAVFTGAGDVVALLLEHGASLNVVDHEFNQEAPSNRTPSRSKGCIRVAAEKGYANVLSQLLDAYDSRNMVPDPAMMLQSFIAAINEGHVTCVEILLAYGLDANSAFMPDSDRNSWTHPVTDDSFAMRQAARSGHVNVLQVLHRAGADPNFASADGWTALHEAARMGSFTSITTLLDDLGAMPNPKLANGSQPIHLAAQEGHTICIKALLERGVDCNVVNSKERTPLHVAAFYGQTAVIHMLLEHGADRNVRETEFTATALDLAHISLKEHSSEPYATKRVEMQRKCIELLAQE